MIQGSTPDTYSDADGILLNNLGIRDPQFLEEAASVISEDNAALISNLPILKIKEWSPEFYRDLHKALLGEIYPWAGEYRKIDVGIAFDNTAYEPWKNVEKKTADVFDYIRKKNLFKDMRTGDKIKNLALVFGTLKNIQPFRDGNTRTALLFTELLARNCGMAIDYSLIDKGDFAIAQLHARDGDPTDLVLQFSIMTAPCNEMRHIKAPRIFADGQEHDILQQVDAYGKWLERDRQDQQKSKGQDDIRSSLPKEGKKTRTQRIMNHHPAKPANGLER